ncbi:MAG: hypothetical protein DLM58_07515 [Pseudonocardiales bacterium]|nr:MAG: hypothetical protein DLM58_07515 [Pseudonocardiales bacterium]
MSESDVVVFVTVAAVRIQTWLTRTPSLKLLRGASHALRDSTSVERITRFLEETGLAATIASDAGDVDGVVVLRVAPGHDPAAIVDAVVTDLGRELPGVEWEAWWTAADGYLEAYRKAVAENDASVGRRSFYPVLADLPAAQSCSGCRCEPAGDRLDDGQRIGADCSVRAGAGKLRKGEATTFEELARCGGLVAGRPQRAVGRQLSRNHLATIAADGNRIGELFDLIADHGNDDLRRTCVASLDAATCETVQQVTRALSKGANVDAVIGHYTGGDDVLIGVPAPLAWQVVNLLIATFEAEIRVRIRGGIEVPAEIDRVLGGVSLGVGVTFAHASHPIAATNRRAHEAMAQAKNEVRGRKGAVSWIDLTAEDELPKGRHLTRAELSDLIGGGNPGGRRDILDLPASARASLAELLRNRRSSPGDTSQGVRQWADRTGRPELAARAEAAKLDMFSDTLSLARWWPELGGGVV